VVRVLRTPAGHGHEEIQHFFLPAMYILIGSNRFHAISKMSSH